tara:strand:- start:8390 stop:9622 length:1233 start_codon:yes stop_codon:yes gene_type:complete
MSDNKKTTMLDLSSPAFNYEAAADALNTVNATRGIREANKSAVELDRREKIHTALQSFGLATAGASIASPPTALFTEIAGGIADLTDGILYSLEGEHGNAALSYASILPVVGAAVAAKRGMKLAEKAGEEMIDIYHAGDEMIDIYHGLGTRYTKDKIRDVGGEKVLVGGQHRWFDELDDTQLEYLFTKVVPNPTDGLRLLKRYKETGEFPTSLTRIKHRIGPKQYKEWGYPKKEWLDDFYDAGELPVRQPPLPTDYFPQQRMDIKEIRKNPFWKSYIHDTGDKFLKGVISPSQYFTTGRAAFATSELDNAMRYGGVGGQEILHFKIPKSFMLKKIKQFKLRGNDTVFGEKFSDVIPFPKGPSSLGKEVKSRDFPIIKQPYTAKQSSAVNEMIFDEGIPMKFLHKVIKGKK